MKKTTFFVVFELQKKIFQREKKAKEGLCSPFFRQLRKKFSLIDM